MNGQDVRTGGRDFRRIAQAIEFLQLNWRARPTLRETAQAIGLSDYHFQRLFLRWAGTTPKRFLQLLTLDHARRALANDRPLLETSLDVGLSGPGRLHDLFVTIDAMTPGDVKQGGAGLSLAYGLHASPFGDCLLVASQRGVCWLGFVEAGGTEDALAEVAAQWPRADIRRRPAVTAPLARAIFTGRGSPSAGPVPLLVKGTNFQIKVWEALVRIPAGSVVSYEALADRIGRPAACRAVGQAVAANVIAYAIPCHRVIRKLGEAGGYRWGATRKAAMVAWERSRDLETAHLEWDGAVTC